MFRSVRALPVLTQAVIVALYNRAIPESALATTIWETRDDRFGSSEDSTWSVLILNDDYTPMEFVVNAIEQFFDMDRESANASHAPRSY